ncbi:MAG: hypothetical protein ACOC2U_03580, partial [bacterium]
KLSAIYHGLDIRNRNNILAVGGSGDAAFMFIGNGINTTAVENDDFQYDFINNRLDYLKKDNYAKFLNMIYGSFDKDYLRDNVKPQNIKRHLNLLDIIKADIFNLSFDKKMFDGVYLSNVLTYGAAWKIAYKTLETFSNDFSQGTIFYISRTLNDKTSIENMGLYEDEKLTSLAREKDRFWKPQVLIKN